MDDLTEGGGGGGGGPGKGFFFLKTPPKGEIKILKKFLKKNFKI